MPIFDYKCRDCGLEFEFIVLKNENPKCSNCNSLDVRKVFSGKVEIQFNADGFYSSSKKFEEERNKSVW